MRGAIGGTLTALMLTGCAATATPPASQESARAGPVACSREGATISAYIGGRQAPCLGAEIEDQVNAVLAWNADAWLPLDPGTAGLLAGVPILIKDNIETIELPTTAGSLALANNDTERDAPLVARLRAAGAIIIGKGNLSEWANMRSFRSSSG